MYQFRRTTSQRMTITLSGLVFKRIEQRSQEEGRSMSNLVAYLLERSLCDDPQTGTKRMPQGISAASYVHRERSRCRSQALGKDSPAKYVAPFHRS